MAHADFATSDNTNARAVSSWLRGIPTDAGSGNEATLIAPSNTTSYDGDDYDEPSPSRRRQHSRRQQAPRRQAPSPAQQPPPDYYDDEAPPSYQRTPAPAPSPYHPYPYYPPPPYPALSSPQNNTPSPTRHRPRTWQTRPVPDATAGSPGPLAVRPGGAGGGCDGPGLPGTDSTQPLRETIIANFRARCPFCAPPHLQSQGSQLPPPPLAFQSQPHWRGEAPGLEEQALPTLQWHSNSNRNNVNNSNQNGNAKAAPCRRCAAARDYVLRPHHNANFLSLHLLPISAVLSFEETVAYVNEAIVARLSGCGGGGGGRAARTYPTLDDFDRVRAAAAMRREVFAGGGLRVDRFGMVRGDVYGN